MVKLKYLRSFFRTIIVLITTIYCTYGYQSVTIPISDTISLKPLQKGLFILDDKASFHFGTNNLESLKFNPAPEGIPNFGISESSSWIKFSICNLTNQGHLVLKCLYPNIENITFYKRENNILKLIEKTGINYPYNQRQYDSQYFLFDIYLPKAATGTYFLQVQTKNPIILPLYIGTYDSVMTSLRRDDRFMCLYVGAVLSLFIYNFFVFLSVRSSIYFVYLLNVLFVGLAQCSFQGYSYRFLWPNAPWMASHALILFTGLAGITSIFFIKIFLNVSSYSKLLNNGIIIWICIHVADVLLALLGFENISYSFTELAAFVSAIYILFVIIFISLKASRTAKIVLFAWIPFLSGICIFILKDWDILPFNSFTNNIMLIGSLFDLMFLSFALADRINQSKHLVETLLIEQQAREKLQKEKTQIQQEALQMELGFLKNQINHHFIFNTINAFYDRALDTDEVLAESIAKFSDIIGYSLKDTQKLIPLSEEISYIQNYIDIHQLRYNSQLCIEFTVEGDTHLFIPPLILVTFVENAFKHGDLQNALQPLRIHVCCGKDSLLFRIHNKKGRHIVTYSGGIGFENIRKRLQMFYNERFTLERQDGIDTFTCLLQINQISKIDYDIP